MAVRTRVRMLVGVGLSALMVVATVGISTAVPSEGELEDARERAAELEREGERAQGDLSRAEAELEVLEGRLARLQEELTVALEVHREAERVAADAAARARSAERELAVVGDELAVSERALASLARDAHKYGVSSASSTLAAVEMLDGDAGTLGDRLHYLSRSMDARSGAIERTAALRVEAAALTERVRAEEAEKRRLEGDAEAARDHAAGLHAQMMDLVSEQSVQVDRIVRLVADVEAQREAAQARVGELEVQVEREREEARQREIERQQREEQERREREERERAERERLERERAEREAQERREREQRERAATEEASSGGGSSGGGVSVVPGPTPELRTVGGITVAASLAPQLEALLNHARADGIVFGGHGYRSPEVTARLRRVNGCPDIYESPASSCRVPTARPGSSMHEKGLAVDFTYRGQTICFPRPGSHCAGNAGFEWLKQHAGTYGLRNLPTEAWHWSTNGR